MPQVTVLINGHEYDVACGEGQEGRTAQLASHVDGKVKELVESVGNVGDQRLLLLASLMLVDELWDQRDAGPRAPVRTDEALRSAALERLAERIDRMADRLEAVRSS